MRPAEAWRLRARTGQAMLVLCAARLAVGLIPFGWWRGTLGRIDGDPRGTAGPEAIRQARRLAAHVERAATRLPFAAKCLPRAMALAWLLQGTGVPYTLKLAVRPAAQRGRIDDLHAWVECEGAIVIGELPGPWIITLILRG